MKKAAFVIIAFIAFGVMGSADYEQEQSQHDRYCEMVGKGLWGAYKQGVTCDD